MLFFKKRSMLIDKSQLAEAFWILDRYDLVLSKTIFRKNISWGNCGWAKAPNCYFVDVYATDKEWYSVLRDFKKKGINLLPETTGY